MELSCIEDTRLSIVAMLFPHIHFTFLMFPPPLDLDLRQNIWIVDWVLDRFVCILDLHLSESQLVNPVYFLFKTNQLFEKKIGILVCHGSFEKVDEGSFAFSRTSFVSWTFT